MDSLATIFSIRYVLLRISRLASARAGNPRGGSKVSTSYGPVVTPVAYVLTILFVVAMTSACSTRCGRWLLLSDARTEWRVADGHHYCERCRLCGAALPEKRGIACKSSITRSLSDGLFARFTDGDRISWSRLSSSTWRRSFSSAPTNFPRELTRIVGVLLLVLTLGMAFTGQVLRFDQHAYWGLGIGASIASRVPVLGPWIVKLLLKPHDEQTRHELGEAAHIDGIE
jgi:Cytochrome b(N-terminal)/b6/petB